MMTTPETKQDKQLRFSNVTIIWGLRSIIGGYGSLMQAGFPNVCLQAFKSGHLNFHLSDVEIDSLEMIAENDTLPAFKAMPVKEETSDEIDEKAIDASYSEDPAARPS